ncbi:single-stranded-DNA-specific exonuclease RecJ [Treponema parvum]|uniref:single-stranded-DNA-specific exonuclease RecJ n=1 Tax=Treponema parvum TaxID=138851 RepID=UPI001AEC5B1A|nr:single-stranded-DNA-specific exonuclease RecJ [Treponema parvum]QTQ16379.1 single-stranded-DNA-specific exonuclease RecJ [Treponema parvum]
MALWNKKPVSKEVIKDLCSRFRIDPVSASIFARRGITEGKDIMYFLENDLRFQHSPFMFKDMEDAVDRILAAKEEGEKVLIFGDRDVDGISSTTILYECLKEMGMDVQWSIPTGDEAYSLSNQVIDAFAAKNGTLIITVDCGITSQEEVAYAAEKYIDVIITDHHNPGENLPEAIILDPKIKDSGYPFRDISGAAVAYKLTQALRFTKSELYKEDICLMNVLPVNEAYTIECIKLRNLAVKDRLFETIIPGTVDISRTKLLPFLNGQQIFVWDERVVKKQLSRIFGNGIEFNLMDLQQEISNLIPSVSGKSLLALKDLSKIAFYSEQPSTEIEGFYNLFVSFVQKKNAKIFPEDVKAEQKDLQLVMLAALADIMPLKNENRIFIKKGLSAINEGQTRPGLNELLALLNMSGKKLTATDISWNVTPVLNAAGRLGQPALAIKLFLAETVKERSVIAENIIALNNERKRIMAEVMLFAEKAARDSLAKYDNKLCIVVDERIPRGVTGLVAQRLAKELDVPAFTVAFLETGTCVGSVRSARGFNAPVFLSQFDDFFIDYGGHDASAGFNFERSKLEEFLQKLEKLSQTIELEKENAKIFEVDAELPAQYMTADVMNIVDSFEPFGMENEPLLFMSKDLKIADVQIMGKTERQHLKITFDCGKNKWPAMFWGEAQRYHRDFEKEDRLDVLFHITRNLFNGMETPQLILEDLKNSVPKP